MIMLCDIVYARGDSMILAFHGTPLARWLGLSDIEKLQLVVTQKNFKITESPSMTE